MALLFFSIQFQLLRKKQISKVAIESPKSRLYVVCCLFNQLCEIFKNVQKKKKLTPMTLRRLQVCATTQEPVTTNFLGVCPEYASCSGKSDLMCKCETSKE